MLITTLVVSFCKDGVGSVNVKLWFLVVYVRCEALCRLVVAGKWCTVPQTSNVASDFVRLLCIYSNVCKVFFIFWIHNKFQYAFGMRKRWQYVWHADVLLSHVTVHTHCSCKMVYCLSTQIAYFKLDTNSGVGFRETYDASFIEAWILRLVYMGWWSKAHSVHISQIKGLEWGCVDLASEPEAWGMRYKGRPYTILFHFV